MILRTYFYATRTLPLLHPHLPRSFDEKVKQNSLISIMKPSRLPYLDLLLCSLLLHRSYSYTIIVKRRILFFLEKNSERIQFVFFLSLIVKKEKLRSVEAKGLVRSDTSKNRGLFRVLLFLSLRKQLCHRILSIACFTPLFLTLADFIKAPWREHDSNVRPSTYQTEKLPLLHLAKHRVAGVGFEPTTFRAYTGRWPKPCPTYRSLYH